MSGRRTTADRLLGEIYHWIFRAQQCGFVLRELVKELESPGTEDSGLSTGGKIALGIVMTPFVGLAGVGLLALINSLSTSASASNVALKAKLEKDEIKARKCSKVEEKVVHLNMKLKSESQQKNADDVDRHVLFEILKALAKPEGLSDPCSICAISQLLNDFQKNRLTSEVFREAVTHLAAVLQFFDINVSLGANQITVKREATAPLGLVGLDFALPEALDNCKRAIEKNDRAKAGKILGDISDTILEASWKLSGSVYEAEKSLAAAVQSQTGQSGTQRYQSETGEGDGAGVVSGASGGAGGGRGGGGGGWGRKHQCEEDGSEDESSDSDEETGLRRKKLRMALLNVRSVSKKSISQGSLISNLILNHRLDFFLITETWLKSDPEGEQALRDLLPSNRNFVHQPRGQGRGGGVAIVFSDEFECRPVTLPGEVSTFECVAASVQHETWDQPVLIVTVYHPTSPNYEEFINFLIEFTLLLTDFSSSYSNIIMAGDFNIWIDNKRKRTGREFADILKENNLEQFVTQPTHQAGHVLDLVSARNMEITDVIVQDDDISDHWTVYFNAEPKSSKKDKKNDEKYTRDRDEL